MEDHTARAEKFEKKAKIDIEKAIEFSEKRFELFQKELPSVSVQQCYEKTAQLAAQIEQYPKAIKMYENIAKHSLKHGLLLGHKVKRHLLNAGICRFCIRGDDASAVAMAKQYAALPIFRDTWQCQFLENIAESVEKRDLTMFRDVVRRFDTMTPLDSCATNLLLRVEEKLKPSMTRRTQRLTLDSITCYTQLYKEIAELFESEKNMEKVADLTPASSTTTFGDGGKQKEMCASLQRSQTNVMRRLPLTESTLLHSNSRIETSDNSNKEDGIRKMGGKPVNWILQKGDLKKKPLNGQTVTFV